MFSSRARRIPAGAIAAAVCCLAVTGIRAAADPATPPNVVYTASGVFASPPIGGADLLHLSGQPFSVTIAANEGAVPEKYGATWATFVGLHLNAIIYSASLPPSIIMPGFTQLSIRPASITLQAGNSSEDAFELRFQDYIIVVAAKASLPPGTLLNALIRPFTSPVLLTPDSATVTYSDPGSGLSTTLGISGILNATIAK
jgi:hypothetical protein